MPIGDNIFSEFVAGIAQLVERNLAKVEVASSNLVSRSKFFKKGRYYSPFIFSAR